MIRFEKGKEMTRCVFMSGHSEVFRQWSASRHLIRSQMAAVKCDHNVIIKTNFPHQHLRFVIKFNCSYVQRSRKQQTELCLQKRRRFLLFCGAYGNKCLPWSYWYLGFFLVLSCRHYYKWRDDVIQSRSDMMVCCEYLQHGNFQQGVQMLLLCS